MRDGLGKPVAVGKHVIRLHASIGGSVYPDDGRDLGVLIDRADSAMYRAKRRGGSEFAFFGDDLTGDALLPSRRRDGRQHPVVSVEQSLLSHGEHLASLQEANEQLVIAAQSKQTASSRCLLGPQTESNPRSTRS